LERRYGLGSGPALSSDNRTRSLIQLGAGELAASGARTLDARLASYSVPCFHIAHIIVASFLASATMAMQLPRFSAIARAQSTAGSCGRERHIDHAAWTNNAFR
jgi:hypothetical protein